MADGTPARIRHAKGVRGALPNPPKSVAELERLRVAVAGLSQREAVEQLRAQGLTLNQCGQVLGVSTPRVVRILRPQGKIAGQLWVRCTRCRWRGRRMVDSHEPCGDCGAPSESVVASAAVLWAKVPIDLDLAPLLGPDVDRAASEIVHAELRRRAAKRDRK